MNPNITFPILLFFISAKVLSQEPKILNGKIIVTDAMVNGVVILNVNAENETFSDAQGYFSILARPGDLLVFHAPHLDNHRKTIDLSDFDSPHIEITMYSKIEELAEVEVVNYKIDAVSARILATPAKKYTPAQRRLKTAGDFKPIHLLGLLGGSLPLDPIVNAISGRTAKLKKEVHIEHREMLLKKINLSYEDSFFSEKLHIPADRVGDFKYFLIQSEAFEKVLLAKKGALIFFEMSKLASKYLIIIQNEK